MPKITVTLKRPHSGRKLSGAGRGVLPDDRPSEILGKPKGEVLLNFYDLGQKWDGSAWRDINWQAIPAISIDTGFTPNILSTADMSSGDSAALKTTILSVPFADWETIYRPLTYADAELYGLDIYIGPNYEAFNASKYLPVAQPGSRHWIIDDPRLVIPRTVNNVKWTVDGLKIPKGTNNFQIWSHGAFCSRKTLDNQYRFTAGPNYTDPFVNFRFNKDCKVFLLPAPTCEWAVGDNSDFNHRANLLNSIYTTVPRELFLSTDFTFTGGFSGLSYTGTVFEYEGNASGSVGDHRLQGLPISDPFQSILMAFMKARTGARVFDLNTFTNMAAGSLGDFPGDIGTWMGGYSFGVDLGSDYFASATGFPKVFNGSLVAMIKKGTDWFYVWQDGGTYAPPHYHNFNFTL